MVASVEKSLCTRKHNHTHFTTFNVGSVLVINEFDFVSPPVYIYCVVILSVEFYRQARTNAIHIYTDLNRSVNVTLQSKISFRQIEWVGLFQFKSKLYTL